MARASAFQAEGRGFEPRFPLLFWVVLSNAHVAQLVEHILGKDEVHRFDPGRGLHVRGAGGRQHGGIKGSFNGSYCLLTEEVSYGKEEI